MLWFDTRAEEVTNHYVSVLGNGKFNSISGGREGQVFFAVDFDTLNQKYIALNGGFCNASLSHGFNSGMARFPTEMETIERLSRENLNKIEAPIEKYRIKCHWERVGELRVAVEPWQMEGFSQEASDCYRLGDHVELLSKEQIQAA